MGVYSNTVSMTQFSIIGEIPSSGLFDLLSKSLSSHAFQSIEDNTDETSEGWVHTDHSDENNFEVPASFIRDHYLFFTYRRDQRKISSAVLKSRCTRGEAEFLKNHPNLRRVPKQKREEIKDLAKVKLLTKTVPTPSTVDAVWDTKKRIFTIFSASSSAFERFENLFSKTFENLRLQLIHPYAKGLAVLGPQNEKSLLDANQSNSDSALSLIKSNQWIGQDLLVWLLCNGVTGRGDYQVLIPGLTAEGSKFSSWVDDNITFQGGGEGGAQKVVVSGSQDEYAEAKAAIRFRKAISAATVYLEANENVWKFKLDGPRFIFSSFRCPAVKIERDGSVEEFSEREAAFYERMYLLEQGLQMFDSLFLIFLQHRLSGNWAQWLDSSLKDWLEAE